MIYFGILLVIVGVVWGIEKLSKMFDTPVQEHEK